MRLVTEPYLEQQRRWPAAGRVVMAQFDDDSVVVYQAYRPAIGNFAAQQGWFGGEFRLDRMTWVKPNFLWMMYRSGWGTKSGQEVVLAVRLRRAAFDQVLATAVSAHHDPGSGTFEQWERDLAVSDVRLQWDPDHSPHGQRLPRRAIQLGLRRSAIRQYSREWLLGIEDISGFVAEQRANVRGRALDRLVTPREEPYPVDWATARRLGMD